jgi:hypothetical protein
MIEPTIALQKAIRDRLVASPDVDVWPELIRTGSTRPEKTPCIIMANATTALHGHDYTAQRAAWVNLDIHVWTIGRGQDAAKAIAFAVCQALDGELHLDVGYCDQLRVTRAVYPRDPDNRVGHGVLSVEALIRWSI